MSNLELRLTYLESPWLATLLIVLAAVAAAAVYGRCFRECSIGQSVLLSLLRFGAILVALLLLLRPILRFEVINKRQERLAVFVDSSQSMGIPDSVGGERRLESALRVVDSEAVHRLAELFQMQFFTFSGPGTVTARPWDEAAPSADLTRREKALQPLGYMTDLQASWKALDPEDAPIAGIVLLSDGRDHGGLAEEMGSASSTATGLPAVPVYTIGLGSGEPEPADLAWVKTSAERKVLLGSRVRVSATVSSRGLPQISTDVVISLDGEEIDRRQQTVAPGIGEFTFELVPRRTGRVIYELVLDPPEREASPENNRTYLVLEVTDRPLQVVFFEGRARWQYKFARRGMDHDPNVNVTGLVKLGGDRLLQQGTAPVNLENGLPGTRKEWQSIDVLVLGNLVEGDLPPALQQLILDWINRDGGGLINAGGAESHRYLRGTPLGEALPCAPGSGDKLTGSLALLPEIAGLEHPVTRGLLRFISDPQQRARLALGEVFECGEVKPGAEVLLAVVDIDESQGKDDDEASEASARAPLLAVRQYGAGRIVSWLTESDWRWVMNLPRGEGERLFNILWGRMARWAARRDGAPGSDGALEVSRSEARVGEKVTVTLFGIKGLARTSVMVTDPRRKRVPLNGVLESDRWLGTFIPELAGVHVFDLERPGGETRESGEQAVLIVHPDSRELENSRPDWELLRGLAARTGGQFLTLAEVGALAEKIIDDNPGMITVVELGTERSWWLFLALVSLLTLEWILRRRLLAI